jgi:hypothetical protein
MNKLFKSTKVLLLVIVLTAFSCSSDDEESVANIPVNIQNLTVTIDENPTDGQVVGTLQTDVSGASNFSIISETPTGALTINSSSGELSVADATMFDFETNPVISATISASDAENPATVTINLNNLGEVSIQDLTVAVDENPTNGQSVGTVQTIGAAAQNFSITTQTPTGALSIDSSSGELTVADATLFDFETNPIITASILTNDASGPATATINLNNLNEVTLQDAMHTIDENPTNGQIIGNIQASEGVGANFSISTQSPAGALSIDANSGELSVADAALFDFEANTSITATITADGTTSSATATIEINNVDEIGDFNYGGVIFWLDGNGGGLVCDIVDQVNPTPNQGINWSIGTNTNTGATGTAIGTGQANTTAIVNNHGAGVYAATLCNNLSTGGYSDWYLPALFELHEIYYQMATISTTAQANGGTPLTGLYHWSSTEMNTNQARVVGTNGGVFSDFSAGKNNSGALVRAVRSFTNL